MNQEQRNFWLSGLNAALGITNIFNGVITDSIFNLLIGGLCLWVSLVCYKSGMKLGNEDDNDF